MRALCIGQYLGYVGYVGLAGRLPDAGSHAPSSLHYPCVTHSRPWHAHRGPRLTETFKVAVARPQPGSDYELVEVVTEDADSTDGGRGKQ